MKISLPFIFYLQTEKYTNMTVIFFTLHILCWATQSNCSNFFSPQFVKQTIEYFSTLGSFCCQTALFSRQVLEPLFYELTASWRLNSQKPIIILKHFIYHLVIETERMKLTNRAMCAISLLYF